jgi:hypothetical protein
MGLARAVLKLLLNESRRRPFTGRILTLGKQDIHFDQKCLVETAAEAGVTLEAPLEPAGAGGQGPAAVGAVPFQALFKSLGFSQCESMDFSDFEKADILFDLNCSEAPPELLGAYDLILDSGTLEHVFHVPNVLKNIFSMLRVGGRIIHISPSTNHIDHGFYMFSPTLFWDFYTANQFELNSVRLVRLAARAVDAGWYLIDYAPGCLNRFSHGGLDDGIYMVATIATKTELSTGDKIPQQGMYVRAWQQSHNSGERKPRKSSTGLRRKVSDAYQSTRPARHALIRMVKGLWYRNPLARIGLKETERY